MFRKLTKLLIVPTMLVAAACSKQTEPTVFQVNAPTYPAGALTTALTVKVNCDYSWDATLEDSSWGSIGKVTETEIEILLGVNTAAADRSNKLVVTSGSQTVTKTISQHGFADLFGKEEVLLVGTVRQNLTFTTPVSWKVRIAEGADWITALDQDFGSKGDVSLRLSAKSEFVDVGDRTGILEFDFNNGSIVRLPVRQRQKDTIEASEDVKELASFEEAEISLTTSYNIDYEVSCSSWIHWVQDGSKALHTRTETFQVEENTSENERVGYISFFNKDGNLMETTVEVIQPGRDPIIDETRFGAYGIDGADYVYTKNGLTQLSRLYMAGNDFALRLFNTADAMVVSLEGFKLLTAAGDDATVLVKVHDRDLLAFSRSYAAKVIYTKDGTWWMRSADGKSYFIIKQ